MVDRLFLYICRYCARLYWGAFRPGGRIRVSASSELSGAIWGDLCRARRTSWCISLDGRPGSVGLDATSVSSHGRKWACEGRFMYSQYTYLGK